MTRTVPPEYEGLWRRTVIHRSSGVSDTTTRVWWFQSSRYHIDLRIPADRPHVADAGALAQLTPAQLQRYAAQTGFAGVTEVDGTRCTWHPEIAFPAVSAELDAGWMRFDSPDQLHETGLDNSYEEDWVRVPSGPMRGLRLQDRDSDAIAYLLISAEWMAWACGRTHEVFAPQAGSAWSEFTVLQKLDAWQVMASNLPWLEGRSFSAEAYDRICARQWQAGESIELSHSAGSWHVAD